MLPVEPAGPPIDPVPLEVPPVPDGLVVPEELEPVPAPGPVAPSRCPQALSERAATTARVAAVH